jgi:hypothetical protein
MKEPYEDELDERMRELFRALDPLEPSPGFAARTMKAVRAEPLPSSRQVLRRPWSAPLAWAALVAGAVTASAALLSQPVTASVMASMVAITLHAAAQLVHFVAVGFELSEPLTVIGNAVARAAGTREGTTTLMLSAAVAGTSLLALRVLLFSKGEESQWQELS